MIRRNDISEIVSRLVAYMLPVTYFLVTVSFYLKTYDSAQVKITLTQIGCSLTAALWIVQLILERRWPFRREDLLLAAPFLALLASGLLSWAHSSFPGGSFEEGLRRVLYSFMGFVALSEFRGLDRFRRLQRWFLAAFGVVVFYGFVQYLDTRLFPPGPGQGLDPFVWRQAFGARVFSSFGNPNFYGNFLVIITPILLGIFLKNGGQAFRPFLLMPVLVAVVALVDMLCLGSFGGLPGAMRLPAQLLLAALVLAAAALVFWRTPTGAAAGMLLFFGVMFLTLYATETKGAWVGFVGSIAAMTVLTGLFLLGRESRRTARRLLAAAAVTVVLGGAVVGHYARQRIQSVSFRVFTWISTWEMIRDTPLLGAGIGTFKWSYPAYRRPEIILLENKSNTETDHAEDEYLEIWSDEGALGLAIFLWMVLTASVTGFKTLGRLTAGGTPAGTARERVFALAAYLGAWWGALSHWFMDVSVRFVSSGVYSLLLPSLVMGLSRSGALPERQDPPSPIDRWVRVGVAVFWTGVFLALPRYYRTSPLAYQVLPALIMGALLWGVGELLEYRLFPGAPTEAPAQRPAPSWPSLAAGGAVLAAWAAFAAPVFRGQFWADLDHNVAIFFSKMGVWSKGGEFDGMAAGAPPDMKEEYGRLGGALDHYEEVVRQNPHFPMAGYFIGNVYNDWGSVHFARFQQARGRGDATAADAALAETRRAWDAAEKAYDKVKAFAPNYVQTHHQVGTLFLKRMEMESALGDPAKARAAGEEALRHFELYRKLDPVFPPNYYRMAQVHVAREEWDKAAAAYRGALLYNTTNVVGRYYPDRNIETYTSLGRLLMGRIDREKGRGAALDASDALFAEAVEAFGGALATYQKGGEAAELQRHAMDAHKALGILYLRAGLRDKAVEHWTWVGRMNPQDADLLAVTGRAPGR